MTIIAILIPLSRVVPPLYEFRIRSRVFRWYRQLREIEGAANEDGAGTARRAELLVRLDQLEIVRSPLALPVDATRLGVLSFYAEVLDEAL